MEKKPDSYVENRSLKEYPTEIGSQNFKPDDLLEFKSIKSIDLKDYYRVEMNRIKSEYESLLESLDINSRIYNARYNFIPKLGETYYLYNGEKGEFLSLIEPSQWDQKLIGQYKMVSDGRWVKVEI